MEKSLLILSDIDDTLFRSNTTYAFLSYVLRPFALRSWKLRLLTGRWSPVFLVLTVLGKLQGRDLVRARSLRLLLGLPKSLLEQQAPRFYDEYLAFKINDDVLALIRNKKGSYYLISSTLDPVARIIGQRLEMTPLSSMLEEANGKLTGNLLQDLTGKKHKVARELADRNPESRLVVVTDNRSDYDLVAMADERFVVIRKESDKHFWANLQPSYLRG